MQEKSRNLCRWGALFALLLLLLSPFGLRAETEKTLTIAADAWCPINCAPDDPNPGLGVELARKIFEPLGYTVRYIVMPWSRALEETKSGKVDVIIGANQHDDPALLFPRHPITSVADGIYVKTENNLKFTGLNSLEGHPLGVIADYGYSPTVQEFIKEHQKIPGAIQFVGGEDALEQNIRKLLAGRIEALIETRIVMDYKLNQLKLREQIKCIGAIPQGNIYLAFSPALKASAERMQQFDEGIERLKKSGELRTLHERYGISAE